ncbi:MAG TPA: hypothetical protein VEU08_24880 [Vicinamibacterales bacterium]|nr:hypothetical protein [Vicinamibacterales bacterium]
MKIPKYWMRHDGEVQTPDGRPLQLFAWGWSESSAGDAESKARDRFASLEQRVSQGLELPRGYAYGDRPVREQILEQVTAADGSVDALLTRNSYGAVVLNTSRAMFVDVDAPEPAARGVGGLLGRLFGKKGEEPPAEDPLTGIRSTLRMAGGSFRVYRTAGGFRLLATDRPFTPASSESESLMRSVGADPAFIQLCRIQDSFRARLTPKPWRMRMAHSVPPAQFPVEPGAQPGFDRWVKEYERAAESRATCSFVESIGSSVIDPAIAPIVRLHDERTRVGSELPLA